MWPQMGQEVLLAALHPYVGGKHQGRGQGFNNEKAKRYKKALPTNNNGLVI